MTAQTIGFEVEAENANVPETRATQQRVLPRFWARTLLRDVVFIVIGLLITELAMQMIVPEYGHDYYDRTLTASHPVIFNTDGYRGPAVPIAKAPGEFRILGLGDSTTFGTGVGVEDTWPLQLRDLLAANSVHPVSAMNVAMQGTNLGDLCYAYEHQWAQYHPDVVVALVSGNMVSFAYMDRNLAPQMPPYVYPQNEQAPTGWHGKIDRLKTDLMHAYGRLCFPHFLSVNMQRALFWVGVLDHRIPDPVHPYGALLAHGWSQPDLPRSEIETGWQVLGRQLQTLKDATAAHGTKLVVAFSPCRFDLSDSVFDNEKDLPKGRLTIDPDKRLAGMCQADGIAFVDVLPALRGARAKLTAERGHTASMYIMFDYNHLNHDGHHAVAQVLLPDVQDVRPAVASR